MSAPRPVGGFSLGSLFDVDLLLLLLRLRGLRHGNGQHALRQIGSDLVGVNAVWQRERALERAVGTFGHMVVLLLLVLLRSLLALDRQHAAGDGDVDILLLKSRQLGG